MSTWMYVEYAVQVGGGWGMNLLLQDVEDLSTMPTMPVTHKPPHVDF